MLRAIDGWEENLKKLPPIAVYGDLELKGVEHKRRTRWAQVYDKADDKFYNLFINRENYIKHKGKRLNLSNFTRKES